MNSDLQIILDTISQNEKISDNQKAELIKAIRKVDKELIIVEFKLERTEKVKRTTSILLKETIQELEQKRKAIENTNSALNKSLFELKATQAQLIQSEKMASLGELTAGIAHEIQNPLNFVNNFSEVSGELLDEVKEEIENDNKSDALEIIDDLKGNLEKIAHHGGRASGIVKGMLDHSRESSGVKEETDINALCDEYLRLSYHGLRAKDKSFNASFETHFEESLPKIKVVSQDIGRVLLNVLNNAFYAVDKKKKEETNIKYEPKVIIKTEQTSPFQGGIEGVDRSEITITIQDNGIGMTQETIEKVFQPFFTTKPTGQGTGLGMSISYDILTKGHGGEMKVDSSQDIGSTFTISLPIQVNLEL